MESCYEICVQNKAYVEGKRDAKQYIVDLLKELLDNAEAVWQPDSYCAGIRTALERVEDFG